MEFVPADTKPNLLFDVSMARRGIYQEKIQHLFEHPDQMLKIQTTDKSTLTQLRTKAARAGVKLVFAVDGDYIFIRCVRIGDQQKRLMLMLREPRKEGWLETQGLELHLEKELEDLKRRGMAEMKAKTGEWILTAAGVKALGAV